MVDFVLEQNLAPLQMPLRREGDSAFLIAEQEIGLPINASDAAIFRRVGEQNEALGIDRIVITRDNGFIGSMGTRPVKLIVLRDNTHRFRFFAMDLGKLIIEIIARAGAMTAHGHTLEHIDCTRFY